MSKRPQFEDQPLPPRIRRRIREEYRQAPQRWARRWTAAAQIGGAALAHFGRRVVKT